ncbi:Signal transduction histidine kinase [Pseudomonas syringae pv. actinidiae]|uniref:Signal transduction histidine kinase n=1 Tax=Pseudomonas syringae pv. actinidiae TaxID=103796 RepID=A0A2V0Q8K9_PSESF|nr:Signal transduction histidine kinase [Pseudomonas syringae pv. actinidiae]
MTVESAHLYPYPRCAAVVLPDRHDSGLIALSCRPSTSLSLGLIAFNPISCGQ